ncbi:MAG: hypothetical protein ACI80S_000034 [Pseudohongiellaceae bacterium]|jgi:hypothetical protein
MSDMKMETRKGYLEGILDQIIVTLNEDLTHRLAIRFKHPIVGDSHEWSNPSRNLPNTKFTMEPQSKSFLIP